jgi:hypothetical protein
LIELKGVILRSGDVERYVPAGVRWLARTAQVTEGIGERCGREYGERG